MSGDDDQRLRIILEQLAQARGLPPPPLTTPDAVASVGSVIDSLLAMLGLAANTGDPADNTGAQTGHAERQQKLNDALTKFPANEEDSAAKLASVGDPNQMLQMATGIGQSVAGGLGGLMSQLNQVPQQVAQVGQQAMQAGMGALQHGAGGGAAAEEALPGELLGAGGGTGELAGAGGGGVGGTTPTAMLGPPPTPSAGTVPASSPTKPPPASSAPEPPTAPRGAMGATPMVPPGAMHGAGAAGSAAKPDTKRVVGPSVKNGAPVQGRITTPPPAPSAPAVTKRMEGKPVASRRILLPEKNPDDGGGDSNR